MYSSLTNITDKVALKGEEYKINTDFRIWIEIEGLLTDEQGDACRRLAKILTLAYPILPSNPYDAVQGIIWFYSGGKDRLRCEQEKEGTKSPCYDLTEDFDYVWAGFLAQYGVDLTECSMHWWKFKVLLECLDDGCKFKKIVAFRSMDTSKIRDRELKAFYNKMKKRFRLRSSSNANLNEELTAEAFAELF